MRGLEGEVKVDDELMVGLLEDIGFNDRVFELFLEDEVLFLEGFQGVETVVGDESGKEYFPEGSWP